MALGIGTLGLASETSMSRASLQLQLKHLSACFFVMLISCACLTTTFGLQSTGVWRSSALMCPTARDSTPRASAMVATERSKHQLC